MQYTPWQDIIAITIRDASNRRKTFGAVDTLEFALNEVKAISLCQGGIFNVVTRWIPVTGRCFMEERFPEMGRIAVYQGYL
jgi:hypothetical protein